MLCRNMCGIVQQLPCHWFKDLTAFAHLAVLFATKYSDKRPTTNKVYRNNNCEGGAIKQYLCVNGTILFYALLIAAGIQQQL